MNPGDLVMQSGEVCTELGHNRLTGSEKMAMTSWKREQMNAC